ncbi:MAG: hypothetical protein J6X18_09095, partial [Bacteroidales bacterium]|nr:hypothetical protein [Bacteroidales bacterium]
MVSPENNNYIFKLCTVEYVDDKSKGLRLKVRIPPYDIGKDITKEGDDGIPWCFPMLPKLLHVNPKVGELVIVFCQQYSSPKSQRLFIGPIISQDYMLDYDYDYSVTEKSPKSSARRLMDGSAVKRAFTPFPNPDEDGENKGTIPEREEIALRGRSNTDIILKDNDINIRCGFKKTPNGTVDKKLHFNSKDLAYILMRYRNGKDEVGDYNSSVNIVADRINLLSHDSRDSFDMGDRKDLITDEELNKILDKAHEIPYGDLLVDFLKKFVDIFNRHTHPFHCTPPALNPADIQSLYPEWQNMLSQSVRV